MLRQRDDVEVVGLVTTITEGFERVAMQGIRLEVLHAQARATGLPVLEARMPQQASGCASRPGSTSPPRASAARRSPWT